MLLLASFLLLVGFLWWGGHPAGIALMAIGFLGQLVLALRLARSTMGGVGGHAEWLRDVSRRPRIDRDPAWLGATATVLLGALVAALA